MRNGNLGPQKPLCDNHRRMDKESTHQRSRVYVLVDQHAPVECSGDGHLEGHEVGEESGFEDWAGSARALECDGDEEAEGEEDIDFVDFVFDILEKGNARDKGANWKGAGEVEENWEDGADRDGETALNYGGDSYLLLFSS
jgi:hypothetical protein